MWGNYANSCQGFAIEFNENDPWFNQRRSEEDDFRHLRRVTYLRNPYPQYFSELTAHDVCYSKLEDWSYEKEWRILQPLKDGIDTGAKGAFGEPIIVFNLTPECIRGVVVGARASKGTIGAIETALDSQSLKHVKLSKQSRRVGRQFQGCCLLLLRPLSVKIAATGLSLCVRTFIIRRHPYSCYERQLESRQALGAHLTSSRTNPQSNNESE
jgi:Protein of unknown function (DUF2971)